MRSCLLIAATSGLVLLVGPGCAGTQTPGHEMTEQPLELSLVTAHDEPLRLADYRGRPLLLFFFATYDSGCQLALTPLVGALPDYESLQVVGVALQPDPSEFLPIFGTSLGLSFPLGYDPDGSLLSGQSPLGVVRGVPEYVLLDERGRVTARHTGVLLEDDALREFLDQSR